MKKVIFPLVVIATVVVALGFSSQAPSGLTGAPDEPTCTNCHQSNPANDGIGQLQLSSSGGLYYESNQTYQMTLHMERTNANAFGFSLTALDSALNMGGSFVITDSVATMLEDFGRAYVNHLNATSDENISQGSADREFEWVAPDTSAGPITFYFASHMVDTSLSLTIDHHVYNDSITIYPIGTAGIGTGIDETQEQEIQVYPNPVHSGEKVNVSGNNPIYVFNSRGDIEIISTKSQFDTKGLSSGIYIVSSGDKVSKLMIY